MGVVLEGRPQNSGFPLVSLSNQPKRVPAKKKQTHMDPQEAHETLVTDPLASALRALTKSLLTEPTLRRSERPQLPSDPKTVPDPNRHYEFTIKVTLWSRETN